MKAKLTANQLKKVMISSELTVDQFNKLFGTTAKSGDMSSMLAAMVEVNDTIMLRNGARIATSNYYTSFKVSTDTPAIAAYYQAKANNASNRAAVTRISGSI